MCLAIMCNSCLCECPPLFILWFEILKSFIWLLIMFHLFRALEHVQANRKNIETELKELLKLCRWEHSESYLSMENSKKTQQKLRKLIKKYTVSDILYFLFSSFVFVCLWIGNILLEGKRLTKRRNIQECIFPSCSSSFLGYDIYNPYILKEFLNLLVIDVFNGDYAILML